MYRNLVKQLVGQAFDMVGDLKETVDYVQFLEGDYDVDTSSPTYTYDWQTGISCIFTRFEEKEADDKVMVLKDFKVLIPAIKFNLVIDQATEDTMVDSNGKAWNIIRYLGVTGGSLHRFHVRAA